MTNLHSYAVHNDWFSYEMVDPCGIFRVFAKVYWKKFLVYGESEI